MWKTAARWPLLLGAVICIGFGVRLIQDIPNGNLGASVVLLCLGSVLLGAFLVVYLRDPMRQEPEKKDDDDDGVE